MHIRVCSAVDITQHTTLATLIYFVYYNIYIRWVIFE
jgi:hypothetical protein